MDTIAVTDRSVESRPDYSSIIREEIEREVAGLIERLSHELDYWKSLDWEPVDGRDSVKPLAIELGYIVNMHRGKDLYKQGDMIAGLPVFISRQHSRSITVIADTVEMFTEEQHSSDGEDIDGNLYAKGSYYDVFDTKDLSQSITW